MDDARCAALILLICKDDDQEFLSILLNRAISSNRHVIVVPYQASTGSEDALGHTFFSATVGKCCRHIVAQLFFLTFSCICLVTNNHRQRTSVVCFVDWHGGSDGNFAKSEIYRGILDRLVDEVHKSYLWGPFLFCSPSHGCLKNTYNVYNTI